MNASTPHIARTESRLLTLSGKEAVILEMLLTQGEMFGLEMVMSSSGKLKRGTIYVTLQRMKEKGLVVSKPEPRCAPEVGIPRRIYSASALGERAFNDNKAIAIIWSSNTVFAGS